MKSSIRLIMIAACLVVLALLGGAISAATIVVPADQPTIQDAVNAAKDGDVIKVMPGTYAEQIVISGKNGILLKGDKATIVPPMTGMQGSIIEADNCEDLHISGFTIDGELGVNVTPGTRGCGGEGLNLFEGVRFYNSSGHIVKGAVINVRWDPLQSSEQGTGIVVHVDDGTARKVQIREMTIKDFQWKGIVISGPVRANIHQNIVTGCGPTDIIVQDCIELGRDPDMTAAITNNELSHALYIPITPPACGVLALEGNENIRVVRNHIHDCTKGVYVYYVSSDTKIMNNTYADNWMDHYTVMDCTKIHANTYDP